ncbi:hypothetical protein GQ44DRAFT_719790 [Phaeosphaeriaceae sp. PMI808]|nr:hypothetical protein GQ44DRAFT_719790 [Phaeosphaeriaceae sp. PMI808]
MSVPWDATTNFTEKRIGRGALYRGLAKDRRLFTFGGSTFLANQSDPDWKQPDSDQYSMWSYDTEAMEWGQYDLTYAVPRRPNWGAVTEATSLGIAFFLNGQVDHGSSYVSYSMTEYVNGTMSNETHNQITYLGGMVIIDLATQIARNVSTDTLGAPRVGGGLVHAMRFGKMINGTLVTFGGMQNASDKNNTFSNGVLIDFSTISLCDTFNEVDVIWFNQSTSGVKSAKDNSSHNVYIYGGYDPIRSIMYDDVYVLSLPSFTWTKLYSGNNPKFGHTCHIAGPRQMMTVGGSLDADMYAVETSGQLPNLTTLKCDQWGGVALFDLSNLTWSSSFNLYAPEYQVPQKVVDVIGGSGYGGATLTEPFGGFAHAAISTMFNPPVTSVSPTIPTSTRAGPRNDNDDYIAGAVVGSVVVMAIIVGLIDLILHRRRRITIPYELSDESSRNKKDKVAQRRELPAQDVPVELPVDQDTAELQDERGDRTTLTSPIELPVNNASD